MRSTIRGLCCAAFTAPLWVGCFTADDIHMSEPGGEDGDKGDGALEDGHMGDGALEDGVDTPDGDMDSSPACVDRGDYVIDDIDVRGQKDVCQRGLVCIEGRCVAEPSCAPGVMTACKLSPADRHGARSWLVDVGEYFYWVENGTTDALGNYRRDGAVVRMKPGEWTREVMQGDLDFFSTAMNVLQGPSELRLRNGWLVGSGSVRFAMRPDGSHFRVYDDAIMAVDEASVGYLRNHESDSLVAVDLESGEERTRLQGTPSAYFFAHAGMLAWLEGYRALQLLEVATGARRTLMPAGALVGFDDRGLFHVDQDLLGIAQITDDELLVWQNVRRLTKFRTALQVRGDEVMWARVSPLAKGAVVLRAPLGKDEFAEVLTEMSMLVEPDFQWADVAMTDRWVSYAAPETYRSARGIAHFVPIAAD